MCILKKIFYKYSWVSISIQLRNTVMPALRTLCNYRIGASKYITQYGQPKLVLITILVLPLHSYTGENMSVSHVGVHHNRH